MLGLLLALLSLLYSCSASTPFLAWSNGPMFSRVSANDLLNTRSMLNGIKQDLVKLDFIIVFSAQSLEFDDISRYGGLYGSTKGTPLGPVQNAMATAASSVWGEVPESKILIEELPRVTYTSAHYLTEMTSPTLLKMSGELQLLVVDLPNGSTREKTLTGHGSKIDHVIQTLEALGASYAIFYTATSSHSYASDSVYSREKRAPSSPSDNEYKEIQLCNASSLIYTLNSPKNVCSLLCIHSTSANNTGTNHIEPVLAVYRPSWVNMVNKSDPYIGTYLCNMTTFKFDDSTVNCNGSSLQKDYLDPLGITSNSINATMNGNCAGNYTLDPRDITLKVEFIFFSGGDKKRFAGSKNASQRLVPLPGNQYLFPGYWTMQLLVYEVGTNKTHYMTQYKRNLDLSSKGDKTYNITLRKGLFYPFTFPYDTSYSCVSDKDHIWSMSGNPNRFVVTKIPFNSTKATNISDGPVLQFVGLQVQAFGTPKNRTNLFSFSPVYECQGYFDVSSWSGTFVVLILAVFLYLAIIALFSTQTVDRFDDPRGRTITVENLH